MKKNEKTWEDNWEESALIQIGAKVPGEFAKIFTAYCGQNRFVNQRELFYNLAKWWYLQDPVFQEHICRDRMQEAFSQDAAERLEENANFDEIEHITSLSKSRDIARKALQREKRLAKIAQPIFRKLNSKHPLSRQDKVNIRTLLSDCEDLLRTKSVAQSKDGPKGA